MKSLPLPRFAALFPALVLIGCSAPPSLPVSASFSTGSISGSVHGGQQPVAGARIYILQATATGYGAASSNIGAVAIAAARGGGVDALGPYFVTDANGGFSISNGYTCAANSQIYLLVRGGNPGLGAGMSNPALALAAVLGACPALGTFQYAIPAVSINELTTVAAVYSMAGFMTGLAQVSTGRSANAAQGLANAFLNATQLVDLSSGSVRELTPNGRGTVPAARLRTLADILAPCVNSAGTDAACQALFRLTTQGGIAPTDTLSALLNIAHAPATNVGALFGLQTANAPFQPSLTAAPTDFTVSLAFSSGNTSPGTPAVDASGSVWLANTASSMLTVLDSLGNRSAGYSPLGGVFGSEVVYITPPAVALDSFGYGWVNSTTSGIVESYSPTQGAGVADGAGMQHADATSQLAIDTAGDVFVTDTTARLVAAFDNNGNALSGTSGFANGIAWGGIAIDNNERFFVADPAGGKVSGFLVSGSAATFSNGAPAVLTGGGLAQPNSLAFDSANTVWVTNSNNSLSAFNASTGAALSTAAFTGGGLSFDTTKQPIISLAVDGAGTPWVANYAGSSVSHFSAAGTALSPDVVGFSVPSCMAKGVAIDPSGDVWVTCDSGTTPVVEFIGAATPVSTPLTPKLAGTRP